MDTENIIPIVTSVGGGFFAGIIVGYFLKKIIKIIMFVAGGVVALLLYLQQEQVISVNIEKLQDSFLLILNSVSSYHNIPQIGDSMSLGIPLIGGLSAGLAIGVMKG
jgi:uncharacterized membrane protein (Fun14 family)